MLCLQGSLETNSSNLVQVLQHLFHDFLWVDKTRLNTGVARSIVGLGIRNWVSVVRYLQNS